MSSTISSHAPILRRAPGSPSNNPRPYAFVTMRGSAITTTPRSVPLRISRPNPCLRRNAACGNMYSTKASPPPATIAAQCAAVLRIPTKQAPEPEITDLDEAEIAAILAQPNRSKIEGQRDKNRDEEKQKVRTHPLASCAALKRLGFWRVSRHAELPAGSAVEIRPGFDRFSGIF